MTQSLLMEWLEAMNFDSERTNSGQENEQFVRMAYRSVLRREADAECLQHYASLLSAGKLQQSELLEILLTSNEASTYAVEADVRFEQFRSADIALRSTELSQYQHYSINELNRAVPGLVGLEYYELHKRRFLEMINALAFIETSLGSGLKILEVGSIFSTKIVRTLLPHSVISTIDILDVNEIAYGSVFALKDLIQSHYRIDLVKDNLETVRLEEEGRFDIVLLCEVIEHLLVNPTKIIAFLLRQLKPGGYLYLTTPNAFKQSNVRMFNMRQMPFPVFPIHYSHEDAPMFHIREFGMSEILHFAREAGAAVSAFYFSDCWDTASAAESMPAHELSNLVVLLQKLG